MGLKRRPVLGAITGVGWRCVRWGLPERVFWGDGFSLGKGGREREGKGEVE